MMDFLYSILRVFLPLFNRELSIGKGVRLDPRAFVARGGPVTIGSSCAIRAGSMLLPSGGFITIGDRSTINHYVVINGEGGITIGYDVMIAAFCSMFAANHNFSRTDIPMSLQGTSSKGGIVIENDVWIGASAVILDGVTIGRGSIVAAGSVVTRNVQPFTMVRGVPAKPFGKR